MRRPRTARRLLAGVLVLSLGVAACDERERTNPLDPMNEETGGTPDWLRAVAGNGRVDLSWRAAPPGGFAAFELFRATDPGPFARVARIEDPRATAFTDSGLANGQPLVYRLDLVLEDEARIVLPEKHAMPGSAVPWVVESGAFGLLVFAPDGRSVRVRTGSGSGHFDIVASPDGASAWAADYFGGRVQRYDDRGSLVATIGVSLPYRIAVDFTREVVWVASWALGGDPTLVAFEVDGGELARFPLREEVRDLVVSDSTGACYVALGRGGGVARASVGDTLSESGGEETIMMLALADGERLYGGDPLEGGVYGYDLETLATDVTVPAITSPQSMTATEACVWVADGSERILCLDRNLQAMEIFEGVGLVSGMDVDEETGTLWLALPNAGRVVRLSSGGEVVSEIPLFQPFGVSIGRAPAPDAVSGS